MPRAWSKAVKNCRKHPTGVRGRACSCKGPGWRYRMGVPDPTTGTVGRPQWSRSFPTAEAADIDQRDLRTRIANGTYTADRGVTVGEFLQQWIARKEAAGRKVTTTVGYRSIVDTHLVPMLGRHRLGSLRPDHVQAMIDGLTNGKGGRRPVGPTTVKNVRAALRAALNDAVRQQLVPRNVAQLVEMPSVRKAAPVAISAARLGTLLRHVEGDALEALWLVDATYGMRRAELLGLGWDDIDQSEALIRVRTTVVEVAGTHRCPRCAGSHHRVLFDTPKTPSGERTYPLVPEVTAALLEHRLRQDHERELYGRDYADHGLLFPRPDGNPLTPSWVSAEFRRLMKSSGAGVGLEKAPTIKALRSSMVTALHEQGVALEVISTVTGHASTAPTRQHYLSVSAERTRIEFAVIAARLVAGRSDRLSDQRTETDVRDEIVRKEAS